MCMLVGRPSTALIFFNIIYVLAHDECGVRSGIILGSAYENEYTNDLWLAYYREGMVYVLCCFLTQYDPRC